MKYLINFLKILLIVFTLAVAGFSMIQKTNIADVPYYQKIFPCSRPIKYSIGNIDKRFGLSKNELVQLSIEAGNIWNKTSGKEVLKYEEGAEFKINLVFDERQEQTLEAEKLNQDLEELELSHEELLKKYGSLNSAYEQKLNAYNKEVERYENKLEEYNEDVNYWNERGGAPSDEYEKLNKKKKELEKEYDKLEKQRKEVNSLADKTNELAAEENKIVGIYNQNLDTYKSKFGESREFEKGFFSGNEINIYQFKEKTDLRLTLAHELGHYLGLGHVENEKSLMYYLIGDQNLENPALTDEDLAELKKICKLK